MLANRARDHAIVCDLVPDQHWRETMMMIMRADRTGRRMIEATPEWLNSMFSHRQLVRLRQGKAVRKGVSRGHTAERRIYWQHVQQKSRRRLQAHVSP